MLGILMIYFIGKFFYDLAARAEKNKWLFAVLGVVVYYAATFLTGIAIGVMIAYGILDLDNVPDIVLGFIALPFGLLAAWGFYTILKRQWTKQETNIESDDILDQIAK